MKTFFPILLLVLMLSYMLRGSIKQNTREDFLAPCIYYVYYPRDAAKWKDELARYATTSDILDEVEHYWILSFKVPGDQCEVVADEIARGTFKYKRGMFKESLINH